MTDCPAGDNCIGDCDDDCLVEAEYPEGFDTDPTSPGFTGEVVDVSEAGIDIETPPHPGSAVWNMDEETWDQFIARTRKPPKVVDGVYDTRRKR